MDDDDRVRVSRTTDKPTMPPGMAEALRSPRIDAIDGLDLRPHFTTRGARTHDPTIGNPNPWAGLIDGDDFHEGFESYTLHTSLASADWVELAGQIAPNGNVWGAAADFNGVVNNAIAQTGPNWNPLGVGFDRQGVVGGPDPLGLQSQFFASPRGTVSPQAVQTNNVFVARLNHDFYLPTTDEPVIVLGDFYLDDISTFVWWRPVSFTQGCIVTNVFLGGYDFQYFAPFVNPDSVVDRIVVLGPKPGSTLEGEFFGGPDPHRIVERQWFQVAIRLGLDSFSVWVRDSTTIGVNGFEQDSIYDAFPGDPTRGAFAGEILATDWLQVFPGVDDDPATAVIEGAGPATNLFGQFPEVLLDVTGSPAGDQLFKNGVDGLQVIGGSDPEQTQVPGFQPHDWYVDNYTVLGSPFLSLPKAPPFCIPFLDDMESWMLGPLSVQTDQWFAPASAAISSDHNRTPGGAQAIRHELTVADGVARETFVRDLPLADATMTEPVEASVFVRQSGPRSMRGVFADDNTRENDFPFRILLGARDGAGVVDDRVYARLPNPNFDPSLREPVGPSIADRHVAGQNTRFVNVPLVDGGGAPITTSLDQWYEVRAVMAPPYNAPGSLRVFIDGVEAFADGSVEGIADLIAPSSVFDELEFWCGYEASGDGNVIWVDDLTVTGPELVRPTPQTIVGAPYTSHPPFELPYFDDFSTYATGRSLGGQGATPWLGALFVDTNAALDIIALAPGEVVDLSTLGYYYTLDSLFDGALPPGLTLGDTVFVVDNIAPALPPNPQPIPGAQHGDPTPVNLRDVECDPYARGEWILLDDDGDPITPIAASPWDGATTVIGRYWHTFITRWGGAVGEERLIEDASLFPVNGTLIELTSSVISSDANQGDLDLLFNSLLPEARPLPGERAALSFDLWVGIDDPAIGPRGRLAWSVFGPGAQAGEIATVVFGGPNNFIDENTFDPADGSITPGPDGEPDDYYLGGPATPGGPPTYADPTRLYVSRPNPMAGFGNPDFISEQTAYTVPGNVWIRCSIEIESDGVWTMTLDDGLGTPFMLGGDALAVSTGPYGGDVQGTDSLDIRAGFDAGASGEPFERPIIWTSLGASAPPEGGAAPLTNDASVQGSYNDVSTPTYFYFEIFEIYPGGQNLPDIIEVDPVSGAAIGPREIAQGDVVALWNDQSTSAFSGVAGAPFLDQLVTNRDFYFTSDGGATIDARGDWIPLGLPGLDGLNDPAPLGGIVNLAPPYSDELPYPSILMGSIVDFPAFGPTTEPASWFIDNVHLELLGCFGDLARDGAVDGADLGLLLGAWGSADPIADLNGDGVVDGADLGLLLGAWGPCT